jgi:YHS domain-containing protein
MTNLKAAARAAIAASVLGVGVLCVANAHGADAPATQPTTQGNVVDLHNTVCPVSGEKVGDSKLTEVYKGKVYHFCCDDCPGDFKKDPEKYAKAVAADPAKYGVKER